MCINRMIKKLFLVLLFCTALLFLMGYLLRPYLWGKVYPSPIQWNGISIDIAYPYRYDIAVESTESFAVIYNDDAPDDCKLVMMSFGSRNINLDLLTKKLSQWDIENSVHGYEEIDFKGYSSLLVQLKDFTIDREKKLYLIIPKKIGIQIACKKQDDLKYFDDVIGNMKFVEK